MFRNGVLSLIPQCFKLCCHSFPKIESNGFVFTITHFPFIIFGQFAIVFFFFATSLDLLHLNWLRFLSTFRWLFWRTIIKHENCFYFFVYLEIAVAPVSTNWWVPLIDLIVFRHFIRQINERWIFCNDSKRKTEFVGHMKGNSRGINYDN